MEGNINGITTICITAKIIDQVRQPIVERIRNHSKTGWRASEIAINIGIRRHAFLNDMTLVDYEKKYAGIQIVRFIEGSSSQVFAYGDLRYISLGSGFMGYHIVVDVVYNSVCNRPYLQ